MRHIFEQDFEKRQHETMYEDGSATVYTMIVREDGTKIAYAQDADENRVICSDIYDVEWNETDWQAAQPVTRA